MSDFWLMFLTVGLLPGLALVKYLFDEWRGRVMLRKRAELFAELGIEPRVTYEEDLRRRQREFIEAKRQAS